MHTPTTKQMSQRYVWGISLLIVLFWSVVVLTTAVPPNSNHWPDSLLAAADAFYMPNWNSFPVGIIGKLDAYSYIYLILFLSITTAYVWKKIFWRMQEKTVSNDLLLGVAWGTFLLILILQTGGQARFFAGEIKQYRDKTVIERYPPVLRDTAFFAQFCRQKLPPYSNCQFASDFNLSTDPGMFLNRFLAYHLYPIDIRGIRREQNTSSCLVVFAARDPDSYVPPGYDIVGRWGSYNLVAVKRPKSP